MTTDNQLKVRSLDQSIRSALDFMRASIQDAWSITRAQMEEYEYEPAVAHTAFAQFLVHNVQNKVYKSIPSSLPVDASLVPNRNRSAYHVRVNVAGELLVTVSTVPNIRSQPRYARFRSDYMSGLQGRFRIVDGPRFEPELPVRPTATYLQILHGPRDRSQHRHYLGFIMVAFPDHNGNYRRPPMLLDDYLESLSASAPIQTSSLPGTDAAAQETIDDTIKIITREQGGEDHGRWVAPDLSVAG